LGCRQIDIDGDGGILLKLLNEFILLGPSALFAKMFLNRLLDLAEFSLLRFPPLLYLDDMVPELRLDWRGYLAWLDDDHRRPRQ